MSWNFNLNQAHRDRPILALCKDYPCECGNTGPICLYHAHAEGLSRVEDGPHVIEWGGAWADSEEDGGGWLPDWWFLRGSEFEITANPIAWMEIPDADLQLQKLQ